MHHEHSHHSHRHLNHFVRVGVVHEGAAVLDLEFVDEGLARIDVRLRQTTDAVHAARQDHAVPVDGGVLRQLVGDEDAHLVTFDRLDRGARRLSVVAPQVGLHAFGEFAHHGFGNQMEFLPIAVHAPRQGPAVESDHRPIFGSAARVQRRLGGHLVHGRRFGNARGLNPSGNEAGARKRGRGTEKTSSRQHFHLLIRRSPMSWSVNGSPVDYRHGLRR
ncbi:hypothetical protein ES703_125881 [subsurface metagenome]